MRLALAVTLAVTLAGCTIPGHAILRDPVSGQTVNCTYMSETYSGPSYRGVGGAIGAGAADGVASAFKERSCINSYLAAGFQCIQGICAPARPTYVKPSTCPVNYVWNGNGCSEVARANPVARPGIPAWCASEGDVWDGQNCSWRGKGLSEAVAAPFPDDPAPAWCLERGAAWRWTGRACIIK